MKNQTLSKDVAKDRLKNVLDAERNGLNQKDLELIGKDLLDVLQSYFETDQEQVAIRVDRIRDKDGTFERMISFSAKVGRVKKSGIQV